MSPSTLFSVKAVNIGTTASTVSLNCAGNPTVTQILGANQSAILTTNWTTPCTTVTVGSSNGLDTHFDDVVYQVGAVTPTPTFTYTPTATATASLTPSLTLTSTPTPLPTSTFTETPTATSTASPTASLTLTPSFTLTPSDTSTPTATDTPTATATSSPTPTATASLTPTLTATATATRTPIPSPTALITEISQLTLNNHPVILDGSGKLISWLSGPYPYDQIVKLAWNYIQNTVPNTQAGIKHYLSYCCYYEPAGGNTSWFHNPAGLYASFVDSLMESYPYTGDSSLITTVQGMLDYQLAHGTTPANWTWPNMPFASAVNGDTEYRGDGSSDRDGANGIEPDKSAELGYGYTRFWELTGNPVYRDAAINIANTLVSKVRAGDATHSPWPFRVNAQTGAIVEEYTANMVAHVKLFDELIHLNLGAVATYQSVRNQAWNWVLTYPMQNNNWTAYFEDIVHDPSMTNKNQITPMETARYILSHDDPGTVDPQWQTHIPVLLVWVRSEFGKGPYYSAWAIDEQSSCCSSFGLGSHTSRWASINALMYERTGDLNYKEDAVRSFGYATYFSDSQGVIQAAFGLGDVWYSDGYGDYIKHYMSGIASIPEWSPANESHILRSSSVVSAVSYGTELVSYTTFDSASRERLRLNFAPNLVTVDGVALPQRGDLNQAGWTYDAVTGVVNLRHDTGTHIVVQNAPPTATFTPSPTDTPSSTPTATFTASPTDTPSITPSFTPDMTDTPSLTPSLTPTLTLTPTPTLSPTVTNTPLPTLTPTTVINNQMPTSVPLPPRNTPLPFPTSTLTPTDTPGPTPTSSSTPTNTLAA